MPVGVVAGKAMTDGAWDKQGSRVRNTGSIECATQKADKVPFSSTPPASEIPLKGACQDHNKSFSSHLYTLVQAHTDVPFSS